MPKHTQQSVFTQVYLGLKSQEFRKSIQEDGFCMYRGLEGRKCAVGHLIPDAEYRASFDNNSDGSSYSINGLIESGECPPTLQAIIDDVGVGFLADLQAVHDSYEHDTDRDDDDAVVTMQDALAKFAASRDLTIPE